MRNRFLLLVSLFLFFESSMEGIINNWTTLFLADVYHMGNRAALYSLSAFVAGMAAMRTVTGAFVRNTDEKKIFSSCYLIIPAALIIIKTGSGIAASVSGLFLLGAGLSYAFPVMLGLIGSRFADTSGTAMSIALVIGLVGNMAVNYLMGAVAKFYGTGNLLLFATVEFVILVSLAAVIFRRV